MQEQVQALERAEIMETAPETPQVQEHEVTPLVQTEVTETVVL